jgi:hypothetical protein
MELIMKNLISLALCSSFLVQSASAAEQPSPKKDRNWKRAACFFVGMNVTSFGMKVVANTMTENLAISTLFDQEADRAENQSNKGEFPTKDGTTQIEHVGFCRMGAAYYNGRGIVNGCIILPLFAMTAYCFINTCKELYV